jgi:hypothetical protein
MDKSREADTIVGSLSEAMASGETGLRYVPALLLRVINEDMWQERVIARTGQIAQFKSFRAFVEAQPLEGLGADIPTIKRLCADNPAALDALDRVTTHAAHRPIEDKSLQCNDLSDQADQGNSAAYAIRKLRADAPELHERVIAGDISPHAAMIQAGFRRKTMQIPTDPAGAARALLRRFTTDEVQQIMAILSGE